jgi:hypothetical protein
MANREMYRKNALNCLQAAIKVRDPSERAALISIAMNFVALVDYVGRRHDYGTAHRGDQYHDMPKDS